MNRRKNHVLRTPHGSERFFLDEAVRHKRILRTVEDHFARWGYVPVLTPVFDYYETYRDLLDNAQTERSYRFPDRSGELLMLRSDITLFLAKQMGLSHSEGSGTSRIYYADTIIRHQEDEDISSEEFFQVGGELIGRPGRTGDMEVLMLLHDLLDNLHLPSWRLHVGSRRLLNAFCADLVDPLALGELLEVRDREGVRSLFDAAEIPASGEIAGFLMNIGTPTEFRRIAAAPPPEIMSAPVRDALDDLVSLTTELTAITGEDRVRVDLSEHGGQPYYTGFTVRAYVEGANAAVASGGRYDDLLGAFGNPAAAAGFSVLMRKIEPLCGLDGIDAESEAVVVDATNFSEAYQRAREIRGEGRTVVFGEEDA